MHITIGSRTFVAKLYDNATAQALKAMLPLTLSMTDLNANEKYHHFPNDLPSDASNPGMIQVGDLMLYQSNSLVLFYKSFSTAYSYTPVGKLADASGLADALGSGNVTITFAR